MYKHYTCCDSLGRKKEKKKERERRRKEKEEEKNVITKGERGYLNFVTTCAHPQII
jgi:hypothetical protein